MLPTVYVYIVVTYYLCIYCCSPLQRKLSEIKLSFSIFLFNNKFHCVVSNNSCISLEFQNNFSLVFLFSFCFSFTNFQKLIRIKFSGTLTVFSMEILKVTPLQQSDCESLLLMPCKIWLVVRSFPYLVQLQITRNQHRFVPFSILGNPQDLSAVIFLIQVLPIRSCEILRELEHPLHGSGGD